MSQEDDVSGPYLYSVWKITYWWFNKSSTKKVFPSDVPCHVDYQPTDLCFLQRPSPGCQKSQTPLPSAKRKITIPSTFIWAPLTFPVIFRQSEKTSICDYLLHYFLAGRSDFAATEFVFPVFTLSYSKLTVSWLLIFHYESGINISV